MKKKLLEEICQYLLNINEYAVYHIDDDAETTKSICLELRKIKNRIEKLKQIK